MSPTIHHKYKYLHSTVQRAKHRRQKFHFCRLPFDVTASLISLFTQKNRLVDSCSKWDTLDPKWELPRGWACSISMTFYRKIGSKAIQAKWSGTSKSKQMERTLSIQKFRLEILVYLWRNPVFPRKVPFGELKSIFDFLPSGFLSNNEDYINKST